MGREDVAESGIGDDGPVSDTNSPGERPLTEPQQGDVSDTPGPSAMAGPSDPSEVRPTGRRNARLGQTVWDMVRSLALVILAVAVVLLLTWRPQPEAVKVVDPTPVLIEARIEAPYPVLYPGDLDSAWRPTSARWEVTPASAPDPAWHVGFVTPDDAYAQIGQSASESAAFVIEQTDGGEVISVGGEWQRYESRGPEGEQTRSLVRIVGGVTVVISGTASWDELTLLADRLSPEALPTAQ